MIKTGPCSPTFGGLSGIATGSKLPHIELEVLGFFIIILAGNQPS